MALTNCAKDIDFADPLQIRRVDRDLMNELSSKAQYIANTYYIRVDLEWDKFILMLERQFWDILNEMLNHDHLWHPSDEN